MKKNKIEGPVRLRFPGGMPTSSCSEPEGLPREIDASAPVCTWKLIRALDSHCTKQKQPDREQREKLLLQEPTAPITPLATPEDRRYFVEELESEFNSPAEAFANLVLYGYSPPQELSIVIALGLQRYFESEGEMELEEIFFGKAKRGQGNHSRRCAIERNYADFFLEASSYSIINLENLDIYHPSLTELAEKFLLRNQHEMDVDSFLRGYRRWITRRSSEIEEKIGHNIQDLSLAVLQSLSRDNPGIIDKKDQEFVELLLQQRGKTGS